MKIKTYLDKNCLKHCAFAEKLKIKRSAFSRYVNGSRIPDLDTYKKIKKASGDKITEYDSLILDAAAGK
jgi:transcriptional regulator with XRE-family HTH domain